jgi:hypothetical protein
MYSMNSDELIWTHYVTVWATLRGEWESADLLRFALVASAYATAYDLGSP